MEGINGILHPLQTPIILEKIFKNLKLRDVKACRLVCKEWRYSSCKSLYQLTTVRMNDSFTYYSELHDRTVPAFLNLFIPNNSTLSRLPLPHSFRIQMKRIDPIFWTHCGERIHSLELHFILFQSADAIRTAIFQQCPNLKKLQLRYTSNENSQVTSESPNLPFLPNKNLTSLKCEVCKFIFGIQPMELIAQFPSLENLDVKSDRGDDYTSQLLSALAIARRNDKTCWKIRCLSLDLECVKGRQDLHAFLIEDTPNLDTLKIKFCGDTTDLFKEILYSHRNILKKLDICFKHNTIINVLSLPNSGTLKNIEELKIQCPIMNSSTFPVNLPNLKILVLEAQQFLLNGIPNNLVFPNCVQLLMYQKSESTISKRDLRKLGGVFPNLEKVRMEHVNNEKFGIVCQLWPKLKHLEILDSYVNDSGISGLDSKDVKRINREGESGSWRPISVPRANLSLLKFLESFRLSLEDSFVVGYCSAVYGLLPHPNLKYINIDNENGPYLGLPNGNTRNKLTPKVLFDEEHFLPDTFELFDDFE